MPIKIQSVEHAKHVLETAKGLKKNSNKGIARHARMYESAAKRYLEANKK